MVKLEFKTKTKIAYSMNVLLLFINRKRGYHGKIYQTDKVNITGLVYGIFEKYVNSVT